MQAWVPRITVLVVGWVMAYLAPRLVAWGMPEEIVSYVPDALAGIVTLTLVGLLYLWDKKKQTAGPLTAIIAQVEELFGHSPGDQALDDKKLTKALELLDSYLSGKHVPWAFRKAILYFAPDWIREKVKAVRRVLDTPPPSMRLR